MCCMCDTNFKIRLNGEQCTSAFYNLRDFRKQGYSLNLIFNFREGLYHAYFYLALTAAVFNNLFCLLQINK